MAIVRMAVIPQHPQTDPPVFLVRPATIFLERGSGSSNTIRLLNLTGFSITVVMPGQGPFGADFLENVPNLGWMERPIGSTTPRGSYPFRVEVGSGKIIAQGNSDPVVIVDDP